MDEDGSKIFATREIVSGDIVSWEGNSYLIEIFPRKPRDLAAPIKLLDITIRATWQEDTCAFKARGEIDAIIDVNDNRELFEAVIDAIREVNRYLSYEKDTYLRFGMAGISL